MANVLLLHCDVDSLLAPDGYLTGRLADGDHELVVAAPSASRDVVSTLHRRGGTFEPMPLDGPPDSAAELHRRLGWLEPVVRRRRPDYLLADTVDGLVYGLVASWLADVPSRYALIANPGCVDGASVDTRQYLLQKVASTLYRLRSTPNGRTSLDGGKEIPLASARRLVGGRDRGVFVAAAGVDVRDHHYVEAPEELSFLMIDDGDDSKAIADYARAVDRIQQRHGDVECRLARWLDGGPDVVEISRVRDFVDGNADKYVGEVDDVADSLGRAAVYVWPSRRRRLSKTVLQAMSTGRPVVTTDCSGGRYAVDSGVNGFVVPPDDVDALTRAMLHFVGEPGLRRRFGDVSRTRAVDDFDVEEVADSVLRALELATRRVPPPIPRDAV